MSGGPAATCARSLGFPAATVLAALSVLAGCVLGNAALAADAAAPPHCIHDGIGRTDTERLVRDAMRVLEQSGHRTAHYRVELRMEDPREPDDPDPRRERVRSVVFMPRDPAALYPLRVHPRSPCAAGWVWQPQRFTAWQHSVLARAREIVETMLSDEPALARIRVQVVEARALLQIELAEAEPAPGRSSRRRFSLTLERDGLRPLRGDRDELPADGGEPIAWPVDR